MKIILTMRTLVILFAATQCSWTLSAQANSGVLGFWREPQGSVIHIDHCGSGDAHDLCATLVLLRPGAPSRVDGHNPDPALHSRSLCGLRIGQGFHLTAPAAAEGGTLYDPKSGKTYKGTMTSSGDHLNLRGYVGIPLFGRSETWTRTAAVETCTTS